MSEAEDAALTMDLYADRGTAPTPQELKRWAELMRRIDTVAAEYEEHECL